MAPCHWDAHNDIHTRNVVLWEEDWSPVILEFGEVNIGEPGTSWRRIITGCLDTRYILVDPESGRWKRTVMPNEVSDWHYKKPLAFNEYVETVPKDFGQATFKRVVGTHWPEAKEKVYHLSIRLGVRCRYRHDCDSSVAQTSQHDDHHSA